MPKPFAEQHLLYHPSTLLLFWVTFLYVFLLNLTGFFTFVMSYHSIQLVD